MKGLTFTLILLFAVSMIAGCGGAKQTGITPAATEKTLDEMPGWYMNPPEDPNFMFTTGTATSRDMQLARDKASSSARVDMGKAIETRMNALTKRFQEEVGTGEDAQYLDMFTQASKEIVSQVLSGAMIDKTEFKNEAGLFRAYILMKMSVGASSQALLNKLKQQEQMYTRFRATQVFDELEQETQKFEEWKAGEAP